MSRIALSGHASGTGTLTFAAPNTNTDRTLTLPDSTGTLATSESTLSQFNATGSAPVYACRAWVNFNGTGTVAIRASGNVSSITDNGTGDYTVNFTTAMPDANYSLLGNCSTDQNFPNAPTVSGVLHINAQITPPYKSPPATTSCRVVTAPDVNVAASFDAEYIDVAIFR